MGEKGRLKGSEYVRSKDQTGAAVMRNRRESPVYTISRKLCHLMMGLIRRILYVPEYCMDRAVCCGPVCEEGGEVR